MAEQVDISPLVQETIIERSRRQLPWKTILGEWIDNAFDAAASTISIEFSKGWICIQDDGRGTPEPKAMVQLGSHKKHATTRLGRYGIGAKDAALVAGGASSMVKIESIHGGIKRALSVDWSQLASWKIDAPSEEPAEIGKCGTKILITPHEKRTPSGSDWTDLLADLGYVFAHAIKGGGRQIKLKRPGVEWTPVIRWEPPLFDGESIISQSISVNGKTAKVTIGVVREGLSNPKHGFTYYHGWRVIEEASDHGCGDHSVSRICGFVELDDSWRLTPNKDGIAGDRDALYAEVERVARPVLERGSRVASSISSKEFETACSEQLAEVLSTARAKAKRGSRTKHGTASPTGKGPKHQQAAVEQPGDTFKSRSTSGGSVRMELGTCQSDDMIGEVVGRRVILNERNPWVRSIWNSENREATVLAAVYLIATSQCLGEADGQLRIPSVSAGATTRDFSALAGRILAGVEDTLAEVKP